MTKNKKPSQKKAEATKPAQKNSPAKKAVTQSRVHVGHCAALVKSGEIKLPLVAAPPVSLAGSCEAQIWANQVMDSEHYIRVETDAQLLKLIQGNMLFIKLENLDHIKVDRELGKRYPGKRGKPLGDKMLYVRPPVKQFVDAVDEDFGNFCNGRHFKRKQWIIKSAGRSREYQRALIKKNSNAAAPSGPTESAHVALSALDITKKGMDSAQVKWMRGFLLNMEKAGVVQATEEFDQSVFHIVVFESYPLYRLKR